MKRRKKLLLLLVCCALVLLLVWWGQRIPYSAVKSISWSSDRAEPPIYHGQLLEDDAGFIIGLLNSALVRSSIAEEYRPSYGGLYYIYTTFIIELHDENVSYKLLWYDHLGFDFLVMHDYHTRLALVKVEDGQEKIWSLSPRATRRFRQWLNEKQTAMYGVENE